MLPLAPKKLHLRMITSHKDLTSQTKPSGLDISSPLRRLPVYRHAFHNHQCVTPKNESNHVPSSEIAVPYFYPHRATRVHTTIHLITHHLTRYLIQRSIRTLYIVKSAGTIEFCQQFFSVDNKNPHSSKFVGT